MAKNYDNYGYDGEGSDNRPSLIRRILIVVMVVIAIILIIYLIKGCSASNNNKPSGDIDNDFNYEETLVQAGKSYFESNADKLPNSIGQCSEVELQKLMDQKLVDVDKFGNCNVTTSYVRVCILEDGTRHYTPWLTCVDKVSENEYNPLVEGTSKDIIANRTYVDFKYMPQELQNGKEVLGDVEELWKEDIKYESYKTLGTTKYYRFRDKLYVWKLTLRTYYTSSGPKTNAKDVKEYFKSSPNSSYKNKSDGTVAYKWYTSTGTKEYYMKNGAKYPSTSAVGDYIYNETPGWTVTRYSSRRWLGTYHDPKKYNVCTKNSDPTILLYTPNACKTGYTFKETIYSCADSDGDLIRANQVSGPTVKCKDYTDWSAWSTTECDPKNTDTCRKATVVMYYWYKLVNETRTYYPSKAKTASGENTYYVDSPVKGAVKDTTTSATVYKWYKETTSKTDNFSALPPKGYYSAARTSEVKWGDWSDWSTKNPKVSDGRDRSIETKTKIKLQEIKGKTGDGWTNINDEYLTESQLIQLYQSKGYKVETLEDITNNGEIRYQIKLFVRNKKESK